MLEERDHTTKTFRKASPLENKMDNHAIVIVEWYLDGSACILSLPGARKATMEPQKT